MTNERVKARLRLSEGFRGAPYQCPAGKWTVGYGRNIEDNPLSTAELVAVLRANPISKEIAELLLENSLRRAEAQLSVYPWYSILDDVRKGVLIDLCYNMGIKSLLGFKRMISALEKDDYETAARELKNSDWFRFDVAKSRSVPLIAAMRFGVESHV